MRAFTQPGSTLFSHRGGAKKSAPSIVLSITLLAAALSGNAQPAYPDRPITLVVPFSAGGDADTAARNLAAAAQTAMGQPIIVTNRPGAGGAIGSNVVRSAKPDGYTLLLGRVGSQVVLPALQNPPPYQFNDFTMLGVLELNPVVCAVRSDSANHSMKDLVDNLRAQPGKLNYSTTGPATILNFAPQVLFDVLGLGKDAAQPIVYKGGSEAALALMSGDVDFSCGNLTSMIGNIAGGRLHALITTTPQRTIDLPQVPTAREAGYPQLESIIGWSALYGPPGLPTEVMARWAPVLAELADNPQWKGATEKAGSIPYLLKPGEAEPFAAAQFEVYQRLGRLLQIELK
ncbi:MAG: tripartite tricarboxylate transporter substrate binding protein [Burkholderiales bacterium]